MKIIALKQEGKVFFKKKNGAQGKVLGMNIDFSWKTNFVSDAFEVLKRKMRKTKRAPGRVILKLQKINYGVKQPFEKLL